MLHSVLEPDPAPVEWYWGAFDSTYMTVTLGVNIRVIPQASRDTTIAARTVSELPPAIGSDTNYAYAQRATVAVAKPLFLGFEVEIGFPGDGRAEVRRDMGAGALALAGLRLGLGALALEGEFAAGGRLLQTTNDPIDTQGVAEVRVRAELWVSPWVTVGGVLGASVIARGDSMTGLYVGFHTRAFGR